MYLDYPYPNFGLFVPAAQQLLAFVRKTDPSIGINHAAQSGYIVLGIGLSLLPESNPTFGGEPRGAAKPEKVSDEALAEHLEAAIAAVPADGARSAGPSALPWALILGQLLPLLLQWLLNRKPQPAA